MAKIAEAIIISTRLKPLSPVLRVRPLPNIRVLLWSGPRAGPGSFKISGSSSQGLRPSQLFQFRVTCTCSTCELTIVAKPPFP